MLRAALRIKSKFTFIIREYMYLTQVEKTYKKIDLKKKAYKMSLAIKFY